MSVLTRCWFLPLAAGLAAVCIHLGALGQEFVYDDLPLVVWNERIQDLRRLGECFSGGYWSDGNTGLYRPLVLVSFALDHALLGAEPWGFKLVNLLLHGGVTAGVVALASALGAARAVAAVAGLLFAWHPVHVEAVVWVSGRAELLCALLSVLTLLGWLRAGEARGRRRGALLGLTAAAFAGALLAKEHALTLLVGAPLVDALAARRGLDRLRERRRELLALLAVAAAALGLRLAALGAAWRPQLVVPLDNPLVPPVTSLLGNTYGLPRGQALVAALGLVPEHLRLLACPRHLSADYSYDQLPLARHLLAVRPALGLALIAGTGWGALALRRRSPLAACGLVLLATTISTSSNLLVRIGTPLAERLLYLPSVGFVLLLAAAWGRAWGRAGAPRRAAAAALACLLGAFAVRTVTRVPVWQDDLTLWTTTVETSPRSARAHLSLGGHLHQAWESGARRDPRLLAAAAAHLARSLEIYPEGADTNERLALCLVELGRPEPALAHFRVAARLRRGAISARARAPWTAAIQAVLSGLPAGEARRRRELEAELEALGRG